MNCTECKARCYPEDPSQPFYAGGGRYLRPLCESCPSYRVPELEDRHLPEPAWTRRQWDNVQQLTARVQHAENKLNEHVDRAKMKSREINKRKEADKAKVVKGGVAL